MISSLLKVFFSSAIYKPKKKSFEDQLPTIDSVSLEVFSFTTSFVFISVSLCLHILFSAKNPSGHSLTHSLLLYSFLYVSSLIQLSIHLFLSFINLFCSLGHYFVVVH